MSKRNKGGLTKKEFATLVRNIHRLFAYISKMKYIQNPKVSPYLSESIALDFIKKNSRLFKLSPNTKSELGGKIADIVLYFVNKIERVEVKATSTRAGFQEFSKTKDLNADYLIWIDLREVFHYQGTMAVIYVLHNPAKYLPKPVIDRKYNFNLKKFIDCKPKKYVYNLGTYVGSGE